MRRYGRGICLLLCCIILMLCLPVTVYATAKNPAENKVDEKNNDRFDTTSPWLKDAQDESIYSNSIDAEEDAQDISAKKPGRIEKYIAELLRNIGSTVISLLQDIGASLDGIVYGRVGSGQPNKVNIYAFELRKGNPYGVTASVCYALLRGMMFIFLGIMFVFQLVKAAWSGQTAKSRDEIRSMLPSIMFKFTALFLMPHFLDVALYVRDVLLYGIKEVTSQMITGGATLSLSKTFLLNAERSGTFVDAVMYMGTVVLTVYFVFLYVAVAIDMLICFVSFPFICILQSRKRDLIGGWIMTMFSNLMTPVIDAVLLLIPLLTSLMLSDTIRGVAVIQLVMCMLLIPARIRFKVLLGIQSNERNGFLGAMAVVTFARAVGSRIKQGVGRITDAISDAKKSHMYGEMADIDQEEEKYLSAVSFDKNGKRENVSDSNNEMEKVKGADLFEDDAEGYQGNMAGKTSDAFIGKEETKHVSAEDQAESEGEDVQGLSKNDLLRRVDQEVEQAKENIDGLKLERSNMVQKDSRLRTEMMDQKEGSESYRELEKEKENVERQTADIDRKIAVETGRLNRLQQQSKELHTAISRTPTSFEDRRADIIRKRANISNFEQPEFKGVLSNTQMRDLYRSRAISKTAKTVAGIGGAVAMGTVAGGSGVFLGASASALSAAGGVLAGGSAGEFSVDVATEVGRVTAPVIKKVKNSAYNAADMAASAYLMNKIRPVVMNIPFYKEETISEINKMEPEKGSGQQEYNRQQIQADAVRAVQQTLSVEGTLQNSAAIRAMQQANLKAEKEIAIIKEENATSLSEGEIREKRIQAQSDALSEAIAMQLETKKGYKKGSAEYHDAVQLIREKVRQILEEKNHPL